MKKHVIASAALVAALFGSTAFARQEGAAGVIQNRTIGYAMSDIHWAMYQTKDAKAECPNGFNDGPREQFKALFPENGAKRSVVDTQLARERAQWFPKLEDDKFPFHEGSGKISFGLNLDGKVGPNDFTSPDGEKGVDNQLWRALGCIANYRGPEGTLYHFTNNYMLRHNYNRVLIELTDVDSLTNDPDVTVTTYRGLDSVLTDATGSTALPGGSQRVDLRWGKQFIQRFKGKITDGVLTTEGKDWTYPATAAFEDVTVQFIRDARFQLKLTTDTGEGFIGGYTDVAAFYRQLNESWSTHHQSYGQESAPSLYRALHRLADAYPDAAGKNTAISSALQVKFTQVFLQHPPRETAAGDEVTKPARH